MTELYFSGPNRFANEITLLKYYNVGGMQVVNSDGIQRGRKYTAIPQLKKE